MKTLLIANFVSFVVTAAVWLFTYHVSKNPLASSLVATSTLLVIATWSYSWVRVRQDKVLESHVPKMRMWSSVLMIYAGTMLLIAVQQAVAPTVHNFAIVLLAFAGPLLFIGSNVIEAAELAEYDVNGTLQLRRAPSISELIVAALPAAFLVGVVLYIFLRLRWQEVRLNISQSTADMTGSFSDE